MSFDVLTIPAECRAHISADYHLWPGDGVGLLESWGKRLQPGDLCIFLGDLYEAWVENHWAGRPGYEALHEVLSNWVARGVQVHLLVGNRDFMAGARCTDLSGMVVHQDPILLNSASSKWLLIHGDELLPEDRSYQRFRTVVRHPLVLSLLKSLPMAWLIRLAQGAREASKEKLSKLPADRFHPNLKMLGSLLVSTHSRHILAGHLHEDRRWSEANPKGGDEVQVQVLPASGTQKLWTLEIGEGRCSELREVSP